MTDTVDLHVHFSLMMWGRDDAIGQGRGASVFLRKNSAFIN